MRIGITVSSTLTDPAQALWASGVHQNAVFLARLFSRLPEVEWAGLVAYPDDRPSVLASPFGVASAGFSSIINELDVLIELGVRASKDEMSAFRARGGKLVSYMAGNAMVMNFEAVANKVPYGEILDHAGFDAAWITPQHWRMNRSYSALTRSSKVRKAPHIWDPCVVEYLKSAFAVAFRWQAPAPGEGWRIGVFDPTVNVVKTFHLPLLACEEAYRTSPAAISRVLLFGAERLKGVAHFEEFCASLDLAREGRVFAEGRHPLVNVLGQHVDAVVTHHWENSLNYLYWDVLYGGFPLIHNSAEISDAGYYFPDFDPKKGGEALLKAVRCHQAGLEDYRVRAERVVRRFRLDEPHVLSCYSQLLSEVMS